MVNVINNILGVKSKPKSSSDNKKTIYKDLKGNILIKNVVSGKKHYYGEDKNGKRLSMLPFVKLAKEAKIVY